MLENIEILNLSQQRKEEAIWGQNQIFVQRLLHELN